MQASRKLAIGKVITVTAAVLALGLVSLAISAAAEPSRPGPNVLTWTPLTLENGWTNAPFATRNAAVAIDGGGIVHLKGAIASGSTGVAFRLPTAFRPKHDVYVVTTLCNAAPGRLFIAPGGNVTVEAANTFSDAQCFTALDGVTYGH